MNLIERLFGAGKKPADVAEMGNQLLTAGTALIKNGMENARTVERALRRGI